MPIYIELPPEKEPSKLADWLELNALLDADNNASMQDLTCVLAGESEPRDDQIAEEETGSDISSQVINEIKSRIKASVDGYPFKLVGDRIVVEDAISNFLPYIFCLLISYYGPTKTKYSPGWRLNKVAKKFEELSAESVKSLFEHKKDNLEVKIFGYPRRWAGQSTNPRFLKALECLCVESKQMTSACRAASATAKDGGLDIIAWRSFPDGLAGCLFFAGQCGVGKDWTEKRYEVNTFFDWFVSDPSPRIQGIFTPHVPDLNSSTNLEEWLKITTTPGGIIFNRCRIAYLVEGWNDQEVKKLCGEALKNIRKEALKHQGLAS